ncbi:MAG: twin-arginine translocation signal domain-containing protein [Betaproteobacteria bacterium]|nr:twin-arginine translocation signal domain-containing protein [Betaproteobacteria bacterium]
MERREFMKACAAGAALAAGGHAAVPAYAAPRLYSRALLVDEYGKPLRAATLVANRNYIFHYPYASTPCFLLNLGRPALQAMTLKTEGGVEYQWQGGVGTARSVVAYSAICAHRLAYPTRQISFISYRDGKTASPTARAHMIHCCAEHSEYDPARGATVVSGPAKQPLAAILLEYDTGRDEIHAVGTLGGELFNKFFEKYDFKLALDHGSAARARGLVDGGAVVSELSSFCRQQVTC